MTKTNIDMNTVRKIAAVIFIVVTALPMLMIASDTPEFQPNIMGLVYAILYFKYGTSIAPRFVTDYLHQWKKMSEHIDS